MPYTPILTTLGFLYDESKNSVLLIHRNLRQGDVHLGKYNGLGGKLDPNEDVVAGMRREFFEEAAVDVTSLELRGTINWTGFGKAGEDWFAFIFLATAWQGSPQPPRDNPEGTLVWVPLPRLLDACSDDERVRTAAELPMWEGDKYFIPHVFGDRSRQFHAHLPYAGGKPLSWRCAWVSLPGANE